MRRGFFSAFRLSLQNEQSPAVQFFELPGEQPLGCLGNRGAVQTGFLQLFEVAVEAARDRNRQFQGAPPSLLKNTLCGLPL